MWTPKGWNGSGSMTLPTIVASTPSLLPQLCSLQFPHTVPIPDFFKVWSLHCSFGYTLTASHITLLRAHCLLPQTFLWSLCENFPKPMAFILHVWCGWHQNVLPALSLARPLVSWLQGYSTWITEQSKPNPKEQLILTTAIVEQDCQSLSS